MSSITHVFLEDMDRSTITGGPRARDDDALWH